MKQDSRGLLAFWAPIQQTVDRLGDKDPQERRLEESGTAGDCQTTRPRPPPLPPWAPQGLGKGHGSVTSPELSPQPLQICALVQSSLYGCPGPAALTTVLQICVSNE